MHKVVIHAPVETVSGIPSWKAYWEERWWHGNVSPQGLEVTKQQAQKDLVFCKTNSWLSLSYGTVISDFFYYYKEIQTCTYFLKIFLLIYFIWKIITLQYCDHFCHTSTWIGYRYKWFLNCFSWDFPGSPVVKTPHSWYRGHRFDPWKGEILRASRHSQIKKKKNASLYFLKFPPWTDQHFTIKDIYKSFSGPIFFPAGPHVLLEM